MYMSPEQCQGCGTSRCQTGRVFAGLPAFEALCGVLRSSGGNGEIIVKHLFQEPVPIRTLASTVPAPIAGLVHRMLLRISRSDPV